MPADGTPPSAEKPRSAAWSLRRIVLAGTVAALVLGVVIGQTLAWIVAGDASFWGSWSALTSAELYDVVRSDIAAVGLVGVGGAALIAYRRQRTAEDQHDLERERHLLTEESTLHGRYTAAADQLGHDRAAVRLAGAIALAQLADEWGLRGRGDRRQSCIDLLCTYLRMAPSATDDGEGQVRRTIQILFAQHLRPSASRFSWSDAAFDFSGATFQELSLEQAHFTGTSVSFKGATFLGDTTFAGAFFAAARVDFRAATFEQESTADFGGTRWGRGADFSSATFAGAADFTLAQFTEAAWFSDAGFTADVSFSNATFAAGAEFSRARFTAQADFGEAKLADADFGRAEFHDADSLLARRSAHFDGAVFSGDHAYFQSTSFRGHASFRGTRFTADHVDLQSAEFADDANFAKATFSGSRVVLGRAVFAGGWTDFSKCRFPNGPDNPVYVRGIVFSGGDVTFEGLHPPSLRTYLQGVAGKRARDDPAE